MPYFSGGPLRETPSTLLLALDAASQGEAYGVTIYEDGGGTVKYLSYLRLRSFAQELAARLQEAKHFSDRILVDPDLPRLDQLVAFWGCLYAQLCPCFIAPSTATDATDVQEIHRQRTWERLGSPPVLTNSLKCSPGRFAFAREIDLAQLPATSTVSTRGSCRGVPVHQTAFHVACETTSEEITVYSYSHDAVWANSSALATILRADLGPKVKLLSCLPWPLPFTMLWHCAAVFHCTSEIHWDLNITNSSKLLRRVVGSQVSEVFVAAPLIFYRRLLGRSPLSSFGKIRWILLSKDDWQMEDVRFLLQSDDMDVNKDQSKDPSTESQMLHFLVSPWGSTLACCKLGCDLVSSPTPGVELHWNNPKTQKGDVMMVAGLWTRGIHALPARTSSRTTGFGWALASRSNDDEDMLQISGLVYSSTEVEHAIEVSPDVMSGSTVACGVDGQLVIVVVPVDATISTREVLAKSLASHVTLTLGLHVQKFLFLAACDLPRTSEGRPQREVVKRWIQGGLIRDEGKLPSEWVFEEDFKVKVLSQTDLDEDALEERMEGAEAAEAAPEHRRFLLVLCDQRTTSQVVHSLELSDELKMFNILEVSSSEALAVIEEKPKEVLEDMVVLQLMQCEEDVHCDAVVSLIQLLQAWDRKHQEAAKVPSLKVLCVSRRRHLRVAGEMMEPRKNFLSGVLLSAAMELPWLKSCQLDAAPTLNDKLLADSIVREMSFGFETPEVLIEPQGARLVRCLRPASLRENGGTMGRCRSALLAGGAGGIGALWAKHLSVESLILLGRSLREAVGPMKVVEQLMRGASDVYYISADISKKKELLATLRNCPAMRYLDFAACLCESFEAPMPLMQLDAVGAMDGAKVKLRGAENFLHMLKDFTSARGARRSALPVLFTSTCVGVNGASQLARYAAGARAVEALCCLESSKKTSLAIHCVALSAWDQIGITSTFPSLASTAPNVGLKVLSAEMGIQALEAASMRFHVPRYSVLMVGLDGQHPRIQALTGGASTASTSRFTTSTVSGCVEMIQAAVRKVLGHEAKLGDSFVELGLDSMSSMSLHSTLCDSSGVSLPLSLFYDEPTVMAAAQYIHREAGVDGGEEDLESMLQDDDARRSYFLSQGRSAMGQGNFQLAREKCQAALMGAEGNAAMAAMSLEAEACRELGLHDVSVEIFQKLLHLTEEIYGLEHPEICVVMGKLLRSSPGDKTSILQRFGSLHRRFLNSLVWPEAAGLASVDVGTSTLEGCRWFRLKTLNLDHQKLGDWEFRTDLLESLGRLEMLDVLKLRRNALQDLPDSWGSLHSLKELYLTGNFLSDLPDSFCNLTKLQVLCLERNRISKLPKAIYAVSRRLLQLGLDEQEASGLCFDEPLMIPKLSILRGRGCKAPLPRLSLTSSGVKVPHANLNTVFWANNHFLQLPDLRNPDVAAVFRSLRLLDLAHNQIASMEMLTLPEASLRNLRDLSLAGNQLKIVPEQINVAMPCLQQLWLHGNELESLPDTLGELTSLAILELHHNRLGSLPSTIDKLQKLNWFFAHANDLCDPHIIKMLNTLPRLKIVGLGCNKIPLQQMDFHSLHASYGLGWNPGIPVAEEVLTEALTTTDLHWDPMRQDEISELLVITFSAQGAPIAQGQAEVRALRDALLKVDALYVCDPANAWFLQDPTLQWKGLEYFEKKISSITSRYRRVFAWGGSMGGSAALLFAHLVDRVHAFSPQVDLVFTWPSFSRLNVRDAFRNKVQDSVLRCRGSVHVHVGAENHTDNRHAAALPADCRVYLHETANHNTMKHLKQRGKLLPLLKFEVMDLLSQSNG